MMKKTNVFYRDLMSGVSSFIPFVVAGGVIISLAFLFDVGNADSTAMNSTNPISVWLLKIGSLAMGLIFPILAGYISYSIADNPGLLPGMMAGLLAREGGSGFFGAILGGFLAGYMINLLKASVKKSPRSFEGMKILILYPIIGTLLVALGMIAINFVAVPLNGIMSYFLENLNPISAALLGAVIGALVTVDVGGPINKVFYLFSVATLMNASGSLVPSIVMGSCAVAGMTISTSCALATHLFPKKFSPELKDAGKPAFVMGMSFIVEGSYPFVIAHPKEVKPSIMTGSALAGALAGLLGVTITAPIGGIFTIPFVNNIPLYLLIFAIGTLVSALMMGVQLKPYIEEMDDPENAAEI